MGGRAAACTPPDALRHRAATRAAPPPPHLVPPIALDDVRALAIVSDVRSPDREGLAHQLGESVGIHECGVAMHHAVVQGHGLPASVPNLLGNRGGGDIDLGTRLDSDAADRSGQRKPRMTASSH